MGQNSFWVVQYGEWGLLCLLHFLITNVGYFSLTPMQYGAKQFVGCAVWGIFPFFW
jgi:hypothetical protein